jgi:quercetin 2,3-dioxygenase
MTTRTIQTVIHPQWVLEGAGVRLQRSIATRRLEYLDPFLLFDHFGSDDPEDYIRGFPMHPHRGIETVTYMLRGNVDHKDSMGNEGSIGAGDVQWMTAGRGILHEEMPRRGEGGMEGFQLWVNLPAKQKMTKPRYQEVTSARIPEVHRPDGTTIRVIAGTVDDTVGAVTEIAADPTCLDVHLASGAIFSDPVPRGHAAFLYLYAGGLVVGASTASATSLLVLSDGDAVSVNGGSEESRFLLISGKPLNEPVARYGPFVMNTEEEIEQTLRDLKSGTFGR